MELAALDSGSCLWTCCGRTGSEKVETLASSALVARGILEVGVRRTKGLLPRGVD